MKTNNLLIHHRFKSIGWALFVISMLHYYFYEIYEFRLWIEPVYVFELFSKNPSPYSWGILSIQLENIDYTITLCLPIISAILLIFSKEKQEDKFTNKIRLSSLQCSILISLVFTLFICLFVYGTLFIGIYLHNLYILPVAYLIRFHYLLLITHFIRKSMKNNIKVERAIHHLTRNNWHKKWMLVDKPSMRLN